MFDSTFWVIYIYMYMWALSRWSNANYHLKSIHPSNSTWFGHVSLRTWFSWQFVVGPKTKGGYESFTSSFVQDLGTRQYELRCWELIKSILRGIDSSQLRLLNTPGTPWILHEFYNFSYLFLMNLKFALKVLKQLRACPSLRLQKSCPWPRMATVQTSLHRPRARNHQNPLMNWQIPWQRLDDRLQAVAIPTYYMSKSSTITYYNSTFVAWTGSDEPCWCLKWVSKNDYNWLQYTCLLLSPKMLLFGLHHKVVIIFGPFHQNVLQSAFKYWTMKTLSNSELQLWTLTLQVWVDSNWRGPHLFDLRSFGVFLSRSSWKQAPKAGLVISLPSGSGGWPVFP